MYKKEEFRLTYDLLWVFEPGLKKWIFENYPVEYGELEALRKETIKLPIIEDPEKEERYGFFLQLVSKYHKLFNS